MPARPDDRYTRYKDFFSTDTGVAYVRGATPTRQHNPQFHTQRKANMEATSKRAFSEVPARRIKMRAGQTFHCDTPVVNQVLTDSFLSHHILSFLITDTEDLCVPAPPDLPQRPRKLRELGNHCLTSIHNLSFQPTVSEHAVLSENRLWDWGGWLTHKVYRRAGAGRIYALHLHRHLARAMHITTMRLERYTMHALNLTAAWNSQGHDWTTIQLWVQGLGLNRFKHHMRDYTKEMRKFIAAYEQHFGMWVAKDVVHSANPYIRLNNVYVTMVRLVDKWEQKYRPILAAGDTPQDMTAQEFFWNFMWPFCVACSSTFGVQESRPHWNVAEGANSVRKSLRDLQHKYDHWHGSSTTLYYLENVPVEGKFPLSWVTDLFCADCYNKTFEEVCAENKEFRDTAAKIKKDYRNWLISKDYNPDRAISQDLRFYLTRHYDCWTRRSLNLDDQI